MSEIPSRDGEKSSYPPPGVAPSSVYQYHNFPQHPTGPHSTPSTTTQTGPSPSYQPQPPAFPTQVVIGIA